LILNISRTSHTNPVADIAGDNVALAGETVADGVVRTTVYLDADDAVATALVPAALVPMRLPST
jgi:hypothetical protein